MSACVAGLVDIGLGLEVLNPNVGDVLYLCEPRKLLATRVRREEKGWGYLHTQVGVHQDLELKVLLALVGDLERGPKRVLGQRDAVHQSKLVRPHLTELLAQHGV